MAYVFAADPTVDGRIHVYEQWATAADLDAHFQHPNFHGMKELLRAYPRVGSLTTKFRVDGSGPVYGPDGVAVGDVLARGLIASSHGPSTMPRRPSDCSRGS